MNNRIYPQQWLSLSKETRNRLVQVFDLERTGVTEIRDQEVVSDGYSVQDLGKITLEAMCEYIGSTETFARAWEITLSKCHAELYPPVAIIQNIDGEPTAVDFDNFKGTTPTFEEDVVEVEAEAIDRVIEEIVMVNSFCDTCDSKGVRHKKECPKYVATK